MLIRLLQAFDRFELDLTAQPSEGKAPRAWKAASGRQAAEQLFPKTHLTMYFHVSSCICHLYSYLKTHIIMP